MSTMIGRPELGLRQSQDAAGLQAVQVREGGLGAAANSPLGGSERSDGVHP